MSDVPPRYWTRDQITQVVGWMLEGLAIAGGGLPDFPDHQVREQVEALIDSAARSDMPAGLDRRERLRFRLTGLVAQCLAGEER